MSRIDCYEFEKKNIPKMWEGKGKRIPSQNLELRKTHYQNSGRGIRGRLSLPGMEENENGIGKKELHVGFVI